MQCILVYTLIVKGYQGRSLSVKCCNRHVSGIKTSLLRFRELILVLNVNVQFLSLSYSVYLLQKKTGVTDLNISCCQCLCLYSTPCLSGLPAETHRQQRRKSLERATVHEGNTWKWTRCTSFKIRAPVNKLSGLKNCDIFSVILAFQVFNLTTVGSGPALSSSQKLWQ